VGATQRQMQALSGRRHAVHRGRATKAVVDMAGLYLARLARQCAHRDVSQLWRDDRQIWTKSEDA